MQGILPLFAIIIIFALKSNARCSLRCTREEIASSTPHCELYDLVTGTVCSVTGSSSLVQRVTRVYLIVTLGSQHTELEIHNQLAPNKLEIVFNRAHNNIEKLTLHNDWIRISPDAFRYLPNLKSLILSETALNSFPRFRLYTPLLTKLLLHNFTLDSPLTRLPRGHVSDLAALETLRICPAFKGMLIDSNTLTNIPALLSLYLCNVSSSENVLVLLEHLLNLTIHYMEITDVSVLSYLPSPHLLRFLDLDFNKINSIKGISRFTDLRILGLYSNEINCISRSNFTGLSQVTFLNLAGNFIDVVFEDTFRDLPFLEKLNLDVNPLVTMSPRSLEYLPNLNTLKLPPMHCDGNLQWLCIVHKKYGLSIDGVCNSPFEFNGFHVYDCSMYVNCTSPYKYSCFDKNRAPCNDGSTCRDTTVGYECVCEGENRVYSRTYGGKCFDIDEIILTITSCDDGASIDRDFNVECTTPKRRP